MWTRDLRWVDDIKEFNVLTQVEPGVKCSE